MPNSGLIPPLIGPDEVHEVMEWVGLAQPSRRTEHSQTPSGPLENQPADPAAAPAREPD
jgi:hypothetical protein